MDSFEWNKVAAAILVSLLLFMGVTLLSEGMFEGDEEIILGSNEPSGETPDAPAVVEGPSFEALLVAAAQNSDPRAFRKCQACHNANEGGRHQIGPNLWSVVNTAIAAKEGYSYSGAMIAKGGTWTYEALDTFLARPSADVPGTKMSFAGIRTVEERAQVIAFLRSISANPATLPEVPIENTGAGETGDGSETNADDGSS